MDRGVSRGSSQEVCVGQDSQLAQYTARQSLLHLSSSCVWLALSMAGDCSHLHIWFTATGPQLQSVLLLLLNLRERHCPPVKQAMVQTHFKDGDPREKQGSGTDPAWTTGSALLCARGKRNTDFNHAESRGQHLQLPESDLLLPGD